MIKLKDVKRVIMLNICYLGIFNRNIDFDFFNSEFFLMEVFEIVFSC